MGPPNAHTAVVLGQNTIVSADACGTEDAAQAGGGTH